MLKYHIEFFFNNGNSTLLNIPLNAYDWLKTCNNENIYCPTIFKLSIHWQNKWEDGWVLNIPLLGYGWIYQITSSQLENHKQYEMTINFFLIGICKNFIIMMRCSLGGWGNGCIVNTCIAFCNMSCFVGKCKFSFIIWHGLGMKFINEQLVSSL